MLSIRVYNTTYVGRKNYIARKQMTRIDAINKIDRINFCKRKTGIQIYLKF